MNHLPANLSPEAAAWMQAQIVIHNARTAAVLRNEINKLDEWANGIFAALRDAIGHTLSELPAMAEPLAHDWARAARNFDQAGRPVRPAQRQEEPAGELEARAMLYRYFVRLGMFPEQGRL